MSQFKAKNGKSWCFDYKDGKGNHYSKSGFNSKREAKEAERVHRIECYAEAKDNFETAVIIKLNQYKMAQKEGTYLKYSQIWKNHLVPFFPNKLLTSYTMRDIDRLVMTLKDEGRSNHTINTVIDFVNIIFNFSIKREMCVKNPCLAYEKLPIKKEEMVWWTEEQFNHVMSFIDDFEYYVLYQTLYWTGARKGEIQALRWSDVDFIKNRLYVDKHYSEALSKELDGRKNGKGYVIPIDSDLVMLLKELKDKNCKIDGFNSNSYVFGTIRTLPSETIRRRFSRAAKEAGEPKMKVHGLRHSHVSYLFNHTNLSVQEIAGRIGDTTEVVLRTYAHLIKENDKKIINAIEAAKLKNRT